MSGDAWASDVPVSLPDAMSSDGLHVKMFGFAFTENGLFHDLNEADHEILRNPTYAPPIDPSNTVYDDGL